MTTYRIVYKIANRIREIKIDAASPMLAFNKFKEMMPTFIYKNLAVQNIEIEMPNPIKPKNLKVCFDCELQIRKTS